ncbi:MAG: WYL domain-containing protein [Acidimicrobiales bacterium]
MTEESVDEARALFLVAGPSSSVTPQVKAALRKLLRALPEPLRQGAEAASAAVVVDAVEWGQARRGWPVPPHLDAVQRAVIEGEQLILGYVARDRSPSTRVVHPLGLATKSSSWYLVADTDAGLRTFRLDRVTAVAPTGNCVVRPPGFDLAAAWQSFTKAIEEGRSRIWASGTANPDIMGILRFLLGPRLRIGPAGADGRVEIQVGGSDVRSVAAQTAGFGAAIELLDPPEARRELARIGAELVTAYG